MSTHKAIDRICILILALTVAICVLAMNAKAFGVQEVHNTGSYAARLFDDSRVHSIDLIVDDWEDFINTCTDEEYIKCDVLIDNELYKNVGLRAKGNTSLTMVAQYGNDRYSFKIEFDHYNKGRTYYGLDKLCLNNIIQDNTYMKDYLCYSLMGQMGVDSPLCSFTQLKVNGEVFGLYLAVEGIEDAFLRRNYGSEGGDLYKPDSSSAGGGRGNGKDFEMDDLQDHMPFAKPDMPQNQNDTDAHPTVSTEQPQAPSKQDMTPPEEMPQQGLADRSAKEPMSSKDTTDTSTGPTASDENTDTEQPQTPAGPDTAAPSDMPQAGRPAGGNMQGFGMGSDDVKLIYSTDDPEDYPNIFDNAKTKVSEKDKERLLKSLRSLNEQTDLESVLDTDEVIRYFAVHNFVCNFDSYTGSIIHNYYLREDKGQLSMIPWDYNLAFGTFMNSGDASAIINFPIDTPVSSGSMEDRPMLSWIFSDSEYTQEYHERLQELVDLLNSEEFMQEYDRVVAMIDPYVQSDPTSFCSYHEFSTATDSLKKFLQLRAESVQKQLDGALGSTEETQDPDDLVDPGDLNLNDLGGMSNGHGNMQMDKNGAAMERSTMQSAENTEQGLPESDQKSTPLLLSGCVLALLISLLILNHIKRNNL